MDKIPRPKPTEEAVAPVLDAAQISALARACSGTSYPALRDLAMVVVLLQTGLLRAELSALNWGDLDLREGLLTVRHGKGGKFRQAPLNPHSHQALLRLNRAALGRARG